MLEGFSIHAPCAKRLSAPLVRLVTGLMLALSAAHGVATPVVEIGPMLLHEGDRIVIPAASPLRSRLVVENVGMQSAPNEVSTPAMVEADASRSVSVLAPLTGRLIDLKVGLGDVVRPGQVVAVVNSPDFSQAQADADKAADALDLARRLLARARGVQEAGGNAMKDIESAESAVHQATADDAHARSRLMALAGRAGGASAAGLLPVTSPIAGTVVGLNVGRGAFINDATAALMTIANVDRVWVTAQVPETLVAGIGSGQPVEVELAAYPDAPMHGRVSFVSPSVEADTRRVKVRIAFANPGGRLKPNMFATARFELPQPRRCQVPTSALLMDNDSITVFVEVAPWIFVRRKVELGAEDADGVRITSGLREGERVVTRGGVLLND